MYSVTGYHFRNYSDPQDFLLIRDFIVSTWSLFCAPVQWTLERWIFSRYVARRFNGITEKLWAGEVGIWEQNGRIISVIHSEGERNGEVFFQVGAEDLPEELYRAMFSFAGEHLGIDQNSSRYYALRIPAGNATACKAAADCGFINSGKLETTSMLTLGKEAIDHPPVLPPKLGLVSAVNRPDHEGWAEAHARAFGYHGHKNLPGAAAHRDLSMLATDYRPDLDIRVITPNGQIAAFCIAWLDRTNSIGILEPVGTIPAYRRLGLGRAVIQEAARRLEELGATHLLVGSDQPFYARLGFTPAARYELWEKRSELHQS